MNTTNTSSERLSRVLFIILIALIFGFTFTSCTVDKRLYRPGFHIERLDKRSAPVEKEKTVEVKKADPPQIKNEVQVPKVEPTNNIQHLSNNNKVNSLVKQQRTPRHKMNSSVSTFISYKNESDKEVNSENQDEETQNDFKKKKVHPWLTVSIVSLFIPWFWILFPLFLILGIQGTKKDPETYSMNKYWRALIITVLIYLVMMLIFLLFLCLMFGGAGIGFTG